MEKQMINTEKNRKDAEQAGYMTNIAETMLLLVDDLAGNLPAYFDNNNEKWLQNIRSMFNVAWNHRVKYINEDLEAKVDNILSNQAKLKEIAKPVFAEPTDQDNFVPLNERKHVNVGTIGHIDHGKSSLSAAILSSADVIFKEDASSIMGHTAMTEGPEFEDGPEFEGYAERSGYAADQHEQETFGPLSNNPLINPKKAKGAIKAPFHATPELGNIQMSNVMAGGGWKYGDFNYHESDVDAQTYLSAMRRHYLLWKDGADSDKESQQSHLAHIMACCAILIETQAMGKMIDNRSKTGLVEAALEASSKTFGEYCEKVDKLK